MDDFGSWLDATLESHGLSQASLARTLGVADSQVSRWRRGRVTPNVSHLGAIAHVFAIPRSSLESLAGYPATTEGDSPDPELAALQAQLGQILDQKLPRPLWASYVRACESLADGLAASLAEALPDKTRALGFARPDQRTNK